jgi:hypothetical protein
MLTQNGNLLAPLRILTYGWKHGILAESILRLVLGWSPGAEEENLRDDISFETTKTPEKRAMYCSNYY